MANPRPLSPGSPRYAERIPGTTIMAQKYVVAKLGQLTAAGNRTVFQAPAGGARIKTAHLAFDVLVYHHATAANTWIFNLRNQSAGLNLLKQNASLSGVSVAATGFKTLPLNNGNSTMNPYAGLQLQLTCSGVPQTLTNCSIFLEWIPLYNQLDN